MRSIFFKMKQRNCQNDNYFCRVAKKVRNLALLSAFVTLEPGLAIAADADCDISQSSIKKLICTNEQLTYFDTLMNVAYLRTIQTAINVTVVKNSQLKWVQSRDICKTADCLKSLYEKQLRWLSKRPKKPMFYKLVMSNDDKACGQALVAFNRGIDKEFPLQTWDVVSSSNVLSRKHGPDNISPKWASLPQGWVTRIDIDNDGVLDTITKQWTPNGITGSREMTTGWLDVKNGTDPDLNHSESSFVESYYLIKTNKFYPSGSFNQQLFDQVTRDSDGQESTKVSFFDVLSINGGAYLTFTSYNLNSQNFEDWHQRKWRVISRYLGADGALEDVCYFVLIRN